MEYKEGLRMLDGERKQLDDVVNKVASKTTTTTMIYVLIAVIIAAVIWKVL